MGVQHRRGMGAGLIAKENPPQSNDLRRLLSLAKFSNRATLPQNTALRLPQQDRIRCSASHR